MIEKPLETIADGTYLKLGVFLPLRRSGTVVIPNYDVNDLAAIAGAQGPHFFHILVRLDGPESVGMDKIWGRGKIGGFP